MEGQKILVAVLYNLEKYILKGDPHDLLAIQYTANTTQKIYEALTLLGYNTTCIAVQDSLAEVKLALRSYSPENTFVFNNCDGFRGNNIAAADVLHIVEAMGFMHTGTTAEGVTLCTDKRRAKERLRTFGIPTPMFQIYEKPEGELRIDFPVIIKPALEDASMGIDLNSVATSHEALYDGIRRVITHYEQPALVEQFIHGREIAVAMWGNDPVEVLPITEEDYSCIVDPLQRVLTFDAKWQPDSFYYQHILARCPASLSSDDESVILETARDTFRAMGLRDFGRVDIRFHEGIPYIIDINELPDLSPDAGFWNSVRAAGYQYPEMIERILQYGMRRTGWL